MSPHTDFIRTSTGSAPAGSQAPTWDPPHGIFTPAERRPKRVDRTALCVQITLCIVVAALLFSVIALPKFRAASSKPVAPAAPRAAAVGR
jgi:hypothetical protein